MSVLFSLQSTIYVLLLLICTATHIRYFRPSLYHRQSRELWKKFLYKCSVIGDRLSPVVAVGCVLVAFRILFID